MLDELPPRAFSGGRISVAYAACLNAARALLSERDVFSRTHTGTWSLLREEALAGRFPLDLVTAAQDLQRQREDTDYAARRFTDKEAVAAVDLARRLIAAIEEQIAG